MNAESQVLFDLVSAKSLSGEEQQAADVFVRHAEVLGYETEIDQVGNAIAHRGSEDADIHIVLLGHIDTVPGDIPVRIEDEILHGRGSVDAKGPLAAMLIGASRANVPDGVRLTVAGAVGEEAAGSVGARHLVDQWRPDACIIGEPSGWDGVTLGYKGRLLATVTATCPNTHSAGKDSSANDEVISWWASVLECVEKFNLGAGRVFDQIQATIDSMSSSSDGLHQRATVNTGFRLPTTMGPQEFAEMIEPLASERVAIRFDGAERAHATSRNDPVVRALSVAIRKQGGRPRPKLKTGTADLNVVAPIWKCPIAAYGPGDSALDHAPNEHIELEEYQRSIRVITGGVESLAEELVIQAGYSQQQNSLA